MIKNTLFSTGQVVTLATGQTYTLKSDEVMLNEQIYKKLDLEIAINQNSSGATPSGVGVGIYKRDGVKNLPAGFSEFGEWEIDTVTQTTLALCVENIQSALFVTASAHVNIKLVENATVTGTYTIDWDEGGLWILTLTGATVFSESNLPASGDTGQISLYIDGDFAVTWPTGWTAVDSTVLGAFDGTASKENQVVVEYKKTSNYWVTITQDS